MGKKIKITESELVTIIQKLIKEDEGVKWWEGKDESQMLDDLDTGAQMLKDYVSQIKTNGGGTQEKDLRDIQEYIEYHITQFIGATEGVG
tara:strand:+ start:42 stop:311 length:270 start_codon:yes stop_codon:yes gene_type:complete